MTKLNIDDVNEILRLWELGVKLKVIATRFNVTQGHVSNLVNKNKLSPRKTKFTESDYLTMIELKQTMSLREIGRIYSVAGSVICIAIRRYKEKLNANPS